MEIIKKPKIREKYYRVDTIPIRFLQYYTEILKKTDLKVKTQFERVNQNLENDGSLHELEAYKRLKDTVTNFLTLIPNYNEILKTIDEQLAKIDY